MNDKARIKSEAILSAIANECKGTIYAGETAGECVREIIGDAAAYFDEVYMLRSADVALLHDMARAYMKEGNHSDYHYKVVNRILCSLTCNIVALADKQYLADIFTSLEGAIEELEDAERRPVRLTGKMLKEQWRDTSDLYAPEPAEGEPDETEPTAPTPE